MIDYRQTIRAQRKALSREAVLSASLAVTRFVVQLPAFQACQHLGYYLSHENEIDPSDIIWRAQQLKKQIYLPIFSDDHTLAFYAIHDKTKFKKNRFGILEPMITRASVTPLQLDCILIPVVAFDAACHRIGRGAGCYDRYLSQTKNATLIGLAYEFQKRGNIIPEKWDIAMDYVVTEKEVISNQGSGISNQATPAKSPPL